MNCLGGSGDVDERPKLDISMADSYGYLVQVRDGQVTIRGAIYDGSSGPVVEVQEKCGVFEERMRAYLGRFVRST